MAECIERGFGAGGKLFRIGGDEFVMLIYAKPEELVKMIDSFKKAEIAWSESNGFTLSASIGIACVGEHEDAKIDELAKIADKRTYEAKAAYYQENGRDSRDYATAK